MVKSVARRLRANLSLTFGDRFFTFKVSGKSKQKPVEQLVSKILRGMSHTPQNFSTKLLDWLLLSLWLATDFECQKSISES